MLLQIDKKNKIYFYIFLFIFLSTTFNFKYNSFLKEYFKVKNILVTKDNIFLEEIKNLSNQSIFNLNKLHLSKLLDKYAFLKSVEIKKIYPDSLEVSIIKSRPIAILYNKTSFTYLGDNGKIFKDKKMYDSIPILQGDIDILKVLEALNLLEKSLYKLENISQIVFFPTKRFNIKLDNGKILKFPIKINLDYINKTFNFLKIMDLDKDIIDFRILGKIILKNE